MTADNNTVGRHSAGTWTRETEDEARRVQTGAMVDPGQHRAEAQS